MGRRSKAATNNHGQLEISRNPAVEDVQVSDDDGMNIEAILKRKT
jgi:hypothetical protein